MPLVFGRNFPVAPRISGLARYFRPMPGDILGPPTISAYSETTWNVATSPQATGSVSWSAGDEIVVLGLSADAGAPLTVSGGVALELNDSSAVASSCWGGVWTGTADSGGSGAFTAARTGTSQPFGIAVWVITGSAGFGGRRIGVSTAKTLSFDRVDARSLVLGALGDWSAGVTTSMAWTPTIGTQREAQSVATFYTAYVGDWADQGAAGTTAYGITGTASTGVHTKILVEVLGNPNAVDAAISPSTVAAAAAVGAVTAQAGSAPAPATVAAVAAVGAPTVRLSVVIAPSTVAATASVGTVTILQSPTPATVAAVAAVGAPTVQTGSAPTPATVVAVADVGAPTVRLSAAIAPSTVAAVAAVGSPTIQTGSAATPATVAAVAAVPAPAVRAGSAPAASTVAATAAVGVVSMSTGETVTAVTVAAVASVPAPSLGGSATITPATVAAVAAVGTVQLPATVAPATVPAVASVPAVSVQAGSRPAPAPVAATASVPAVTVRLSVAIAASTVNATAAVPSPVLHAGATVLAATVVALGAVGAATVTSGVITPATVAAIAQVGTVTVQVVPTVARYGIDGSATAPLLSGTATPGPTLSGDTGTGITSDMALTVASTLG